MVEEAEQFADEDKAQRERIESRNGLENYAFSLKTQVHDDDGLGGKLDDEDKETVRLPPLHWITPGTNANCTRSSTPSRRPSSGSRRTAPRLPPRTTTSRRRSCRASRTPSRPRSTRRVRALARARTTSLPTTTSCDLDKVESCF